MHNATNEAVGERGYKVWACASIKLQDFSSVGGRRLESPSLLEHLPQLNECRFIVAKIHLQFDPVRVFHDCAHRCVNHAAIQVGLDLVAYFKLGF